MNFFKRQVLVFTAILFLFSIIFVSPTAHGACLVLTKNLKKGNQGSSVTLLQNFLVAKGYLSSASAKTGKGIFGSKTQKAVMAYQKSVGIDPTGFVGQLTRNAIDADSCVDTSGGTFDPSIGINQGAGGDLDGSGTIVSTSSSQNVFGSPISISLATERASNIFSQADSIRFFVTAKNNSFDRAQMKFQSACGVHFEIGSYKSVDYSNCRAAGDTISINPQASFVWQFTYFPKASGVLPLGEKLLAVFADGYGQASTTLTIVTTPAEQLIQSSGGSSGGSSSGGSSTPPPGPNYNTTFKVYDSVGGYTGQPIPFSPLVNVAHTGWQGYFFANPPVYSGDPDEAATRAWARSLPLNTVAIPDIESWPVNIQFGSQANVTASINKYVQVINWVRSERPDLKIGVYSTAPISEYGPAVNYGKLLAGDPSVASQSAQITARYESLLAASDFMSPIANAADYVFPALYTHVPDQQDWVYYAQETIKLAKRYGKPIYPFISPKYVAGASAGQPLPLDFWRLQMDTVKNTGVNGFIVWDSGWRPVEQGGLLPWQNFPWIAETEDFINDNLIRSGGGAATVLSIEQQARADRMASMSLLYGGCSLLFAGGFLWLSQRKKRLQ